jgi:hypothetical protein
LNHQAGDRSRDPKNWKIVYPSPERLEYAAGVCVLEAPDDLHTEKAEAQIQYLPFGEGGSLGSIAYGGGWLCDFLQRPTPGALCVIQVSIDRECNG